MLRKDFASTVPEVGQVPPAKSGIPHGTTPNEGEAEVEDGGAEEDGGGAAVGDLGPTVGCG